MPFFVKIFLGVASTCFFFFNFQLKVVKLLLENKADPNLFNSNGETPLHIAVKLADPKLFVELLLEKGAYPNVVNQEGLTPLDCAFCGSKREILKILLEHG